MFEHTSNNNTICEIRVVAMVLTAIVSWLFGCLLHFLAGVQLTHPQRGMYWYIEHDKLALINCAGTKLSGSNLALFLCTRLCDDLPCSVCF
jgi:hypothetical protein